MFFHTSLLHPSGRWFPSPPKESTRRFKHQAFAFSKKGFRGANVPCSQKATLVCACWRFFFFFFFLLEIFIHQPGRAASRAQRVLTERFPAKDGNGGGGGETEQQICAGEMVSMAHYFSGTTHRARGPLGADSKATPEGKSPIRTSAPGPTHSPSWEFSLTACPSACCLFERSSAYKRTPAQLDAAWGAFECRLVHLVLSPVPAPHPSPSMSQSQSEPNS